MPEEEPRKKPGPKPKVEATEKTEKKARKKPGPKPKGTRKTAKATKQAKTAKSTRTTKAEPVAAGQTYKEIADEINAKAVKEAITKADKQAEALKAAVKLMERFTEHLVEEAKYQINIADQYAEYSEILEDMV